ncbi:hypothetical protein [Luteirhabdus pelagi]|uniref:hypothetical protein n=1 Tax=Luteirhabdus pelagi TaxID=2792783 RepID=UPI00193981AF|nr:hypothetical protein [Luteirhabdus pelagi]
MKKALIRKSIADKKLKLSKRRWLNHFSIVAFFGLMLLTFIFFLSKKYYEGEITSLDSLAFWFLGVPLTLGIAFYYIQDRRLKFKVVKTRLSKVELNKAIKAVAEELEWHIEFKKNNVIVAKTHPGFISGSWGEHITILIDNDTVMVNSICDPDKKTSLVSMGRNRINENRLVEKIRQSGA